jgi:multiple sugar transport system substrate-binding protein
MALSTTGCDNSNKEKPFAPSLDTTTQCTISVKGHYDNFEALVEQTHKFQAFYPNVEITYTKVDDYTKEDVINNLFIGGSAPDIFFVNNAWESDSRYTNLFNYAEDLSDPSTGIDLDVVRDGLVYKDSAGRVPFVPIFTNSYGMIVNEEIFSKNNLSIPKTYTQLVHVCNSLIELGYESPIMSYNASLYSLYFPYFLSTINGNKEAVDALNTLESSAGSYMRSGLEKANDFNNYHFIDKAKCTEEIAKDNTDSICLRFYKGDVPMMFTEVNRLSGSAKREASSDEYKKNPFKYSFQPIPTTDNGGYFFNTITLSFAVNKESKNLAMTNEFMRFLIRSQSLNEMNSSKRQVSPAKVLGDDKLFNSFKKVLKDDRVLYNYVVGLSSGADTQARKTFDALLNGATIEEAMAGYGSY